MTLPFCVLEEGRTRKPTETVSATDPGECSQRNLVGEAVGNHQSEGNAKREKFGEGHEKDLHQEMMTGGANSLWVNRTWTVLATTERIRPIKASTTVHAACYSAPSSCSR